MVSKICSWFSSKLRHALFCSLWSNQPWRRGAFPNWQQEPSNFTTDTTEPNMAFRWTPGSQYGHRKTLNSDWTRWSDRCCCCCYCCCCGLTPYRVVRSAVNPDRAKRTHYGHIWLYWCNICIFWENIGHFQCLPWSKSLCGDTKIRYLQETEKLAVLC